MLNQSGAIPFRQRGERIEYLLVTSKGGNWIFPKGIVEPGESAEHTAAKECGEEAGVCGHIVGHVGTYRARKWKHDCVVHVYLLRFESEVEPWEERHIRERRWLCFDDAVAVLKKDELRRLLEDAHARLESELFDSEGTTGDLRSAAPTG